MKALEESKVATEKFQLVEYLIGVKRYLHEMEDLKTRTKELKDDLAKYEKESKLVLTKEQKKILLDAPHMYKGQKIREILPSLFE